MPTAREYDAITIAGGRAKRLGNIDKTTLKFNGRTLLQCALDAVRDAQKVAVVGFAIDLAPAEGLTHTVGQPRWAGPAAALAAGMHSLRLSSSEHTVVIAVDLPRVAGAVALPLTAAEERWGHRRRAVRGRRHPNRRHQERD